MDGYDAQCIKAGNLMGAAAPSDGFISNKFDGVAPTGHALSEEGYALDMGLEPNKFPRQGGHDTYTGIPGDGEVPG